MNDIRSLQLPHAQLDFQGASALLGHMIRCSSSEGGLASPRAFFGTLFQAELQARELADSRGVCGADHGANLLQIYRDLATSSASATDDLLYGAALLHGCYQGAFVGLTVRIRRMLPLLFLKHEDREETLRALCRLGLGGPAAAALSGAPHPGPQRVRESIVRRILQSGERRGSVKVDGRGRQPGPSETTLAGERPGVAAEALVKNLPDFPKLLDTTPQAHFHDLRHHFASWYVMRDGALPALQQILGHATLTMTMRYAHLSPKHLREAIEKTERQTLEINAPSTHRAVESSERLVTPHAPVAQLDRASDF